ncbi:hypothetical protein CYK37_05915 [Mesorhizobium loti]|nr:hypothetical protein [Mesorhizobium loti]PLP60656.1 hypothetical protein CYK37_05915 [Mesorhizobium loti]
MRDKDRAEPTVQRMLAWAEGQVSALEAKAAFEIDRTALDELFPKSMICMTRLEIRQKHAWAPG